MAATQCPGLMSVHRASRIGDRRPRASADAFGCVGTGRLSIEVGELVECCEAPCDCGQVGLEQVTELGEVVWLVVDESPEQRPRVRSGTGQQIRGQFTRGVVVRRSLPAVIANIVSWLHEVAGGARAQLRAVHQWRA